MELVNNTHRLEMTIDATDRIRCHCPSIQVLTGKNDVEAPAIPVISSRFSRLSNW